MKIRSDFRPSVIFLLTTLMFFYVFGQNQLWMPVGGDFLEPDLDPLLTRHSIYGDNYIRIDHLTTIPAQGIFGTAGYLERTNSNPSMLAQGLSQGAFQELRIQDVRIGSLGVPAEKSGNAFYAIGNPIINATQQNPVYGTKPKFPDVRLSNTAFWNALFNSTPTGTSSGGNAYISPHSTINQPGRYRGIIQGTNQTVEIRAGGVYYVRNTGAAGAGSIQITGTGSKLLIDSAGVTNGNYKTVIYVESNFFIGDKAEFQIIPRGYDRATGKVPDWARGQIVIIVAGSGEIKFGNNSVFVGTLIAPNAKVFLNNGTRFHGQIMAREIELINVNGDSFEFDPIKTDEVTAAVSAKEFTRPQCGTENIPDSITVSLSQAISVPVNISYTVSGGPAAGNFILNSGTIKIPAGSTTGTIPITIIAAGNNWLPDVNFSVNLTWHSFDSEPKNPINLTYAASPLMTIRMEGTQQFPPDLPAFNQANNRPIEFAQNHPTQHPGNADQIVGIFTAVEGVTYEITQNYNEGNGDWFGINASQIITTAAYRANYENAAQRNGIQIAARAVKTGNIECVRYSQSSNILIQIRPWNDNAFETQNISRTVPERDSVDIPVSAWFVADADSLSANNRQSMVGVSLSSLPGGWQNTNIGEQTVTTERGATVSVRDNGATVRYVLPSYGKICESDDYFFITARDSAVYGYNTDHFDKSIRVDITITPGNFFPPVTQLKEIELCKYANETITINSIKITDDDNCPGQSPATNTFVKPLSSDLASRGASVNIIDGNLFYDLSGIDADFAADGTVLDTIRYTVFDGAHTGEGKIAVRINPVKDRKPTATDAVIEVTIGQDGQIRQVNGDWIFDNNFLLAVLSVHDFSQPGGGIVVELDNANTGRFVISVPRNISEDEQYSFTYRIVDNAKYSCDDKEKISDPITVTLMFRLPDDRAARPVGDTIIVFQSGDTTLLWNGENNVMANDLRSMNDMFGPRSVELASPPSKVTNAFLLNADGTFKYAHDGSADIRDEFSYWLYSDAPGNVRSDFEGFVDVFINLRNLHKPTLTPKTGSVNAQETKTFSVIIANEDRDSDRNTVLVLDATKPPVANDAAAEVSIADNNSITFKYNGDLNAQREVTVTFWVNDKVSYWEYFRNSYGQLDSIPYTEHGSYPNVIRITVLPNPKAVDYTMLVKRELGTTSELIASGGTIHTSVLEGISFLNGVNYALALTGSTKNGNLLFNTNNGRVTYTHENPAGLADSFTYTLTVTLSDNTKISSTGTVRITILPREPYFVAGGAFYEDSNGDGVIDRVTIPFDRKIDLATTEFKITLNGIELKTGNIKFGANDSTAVIELLDAPQNTTSGNMTISATHKSFDNAQHSGTAQDRASPVITNAEYVKSLVGSDTLKLILSERAEISVENGNLPFIFVTKSGAFYHISFETMISHGDGIFTFVVNKSDNAKISEGDSIFINWKESDELVVVKDIPFGNKQTIAGNKRVPVKMKVVTEIISVSYYSESEPANGRIDLIEINLGTRIEQDLVEKILAALVLSPTRNFEKGEIVSVTDKGFSFKVTETRDGEPKTDLFDDDFVRMPTIDGSAITISESRIKAIDKVAPVIIRATYNWAEKNLEVEFSEPVTDNSGNPYAFWASNPRMSREYEIYFSTGIPIKVGANVLRYEVHSASIPYPISGDSIWIIQGGVISDTLNNMQHKATIRAPLTVVPEYPADVELHVYPQPLKMVKAGKSSEPKKFEESFRTYYGIPAHLSKGVAVILEAKSPEITDMRGTVRIIDQTGNAVTGEMEMMLTYIPERNIHALIAVWDGKNRSDRNVGAASYLALIQVEIIFGEREEIRNYRRIIAVTSGN